MKQFFILLYLFLLTQISVAQTPVAYYPFTGNANDAIGTLHGTVNGGAALTTDRFGNANSAYNFDGVDDAISFAALPMTNTDNFTLIAWVNPAVFSSLNQFNKMIISLGPGSNGYNMGMGNNSGSGSGNELGGLYNLVSWLHSGSFFSTINTWYHVAMVRESGFTKFYMNAVLAPITSNTSPSAPSSPFHIGGQDFDPTHYWQGKIDDVKIYNVALTALQIQQEYASSSQIQKPGSGNAISFNGSTQSVSILNTATLNFGINDFSVAFWYNSVDNGRGEIIFEKRDDNCGDGQNWAIKKSASEVYFEINVPGPTSDLVIIPSAGDGKWHHIVFTRTATQLSGFKDGILIATTSASAQNVNNTAPIQIGTGPCSPFFPGGNGFFTGRLDEIQFWNTALTQAQIRDRMCRKITNTDALYSNLAAYYNFDESTGITAFDGTINANNGTLTNAPTRVASGAAIGNASSHDYVNAIKTASLVHASGENFTVTSSTGNPNGMQVYRVDEQPNTLSGTAGVGNNNKYFGVFQVNGTSPTYQAVYNYLGNSLVNGINENTLTLFKRNDNAATAFTISSATLNISAKTLTATGQSTEYILGSTGAPLPLNYISFTGTKYGNTVYLKWTTTNEINTSHFDIERSKNGIAFTKIAALTSNNTSGINNYSLDDLKPLTGLNFYRLKQVDLDGKLTHSNIVKILFEGFDKTLNIYPSQAKSFVLLDFGSTKPNIFINIFDVQGKLIMQTTIINQSPLKLNISNLANGKYFVQVSDGVLNANGSFIKL